MPYDYHKVKDLCEEMGCEGVTGRIFFKAGFIKKLCKLLGVEYSKLSKTGKVALKGDAIEVYCGRGCNFNEDPSHYYKYR